MSTNLPVGFQNAGVPMNPEALSQALANVGGDEPTGGAFDGRELLKMVKGSGDWVFGQDETELGDELVAVNPFSFQHGYVCWVARQIAGEAMAPITAPMPDKSKLPEHEKPWDSQLRFDAQLMDDGTELLFKTTALGGKEAIRKLAQAIASQFSVDPEHPVPLVRFESSSYEHKEWGKIHKPIFEIVEWIGLGGEEAEQLEAAEPEPARTVSRRRRRA